MSNIDKQDAKKLHDSIAHTRRCMELEIESMKHLDEKLQRLQTYAQLLQSTGFSDSDTIKKSQKELIAEAIAEMSMAMHGIGLRVKDTHGSYIKLDENIRFMLKYISNRNVE